MDFFSLIHSDSLNTRARIADSRRIIRNQIERRSAQILCPPLLLRGRRAFFYSAFRWYALRIKRNAKLHLTNYKLSLKSLLIRNSIIFAGDPQWQRYKILRYDDRREDWIWTMWKSFN